MLNTNNLSSKIQKLNEEFEREAKNELVSTPHINLASINQFTLNELFDINVSDVSERISKIIDQDSAKTNKEITLEVLRQISKSHKSRLIRKMARKLVKERGGE